MIDPFTIGLIVAGGSAIIGGISSAITNAKANKASAREVAKLEEIAAKVQRPDFDINSLEAPELDLVFNYSPESIPLIQEKNPQLVQKSPLAQNYLSSQEGALSRFEQLAETGEDAGLIAAREGAERETMETLSRAQAERESMAQRRGLGLGSGASLALQQADVANTAERQQMMNEAAAADAALRRFQANQAVGSLGSQLYGQEMNEQATNVGMMNAYNQRMADRAQNVATQNVGARNQADLLRAQERQRIADFNQQSQYANELQKRQFQQQDYQNQLSQAQTQMSPGQARLGQVDKSAQRTQQTTGGLTSAGISIGGLLGSRK